MSIAKRLDVHFVACAAAAGAALVGTTQKSEAAVVFWGGANLDITPSTNGLYLNVQTYPAAGSTNQPGSTSGGTVPGWDINPWGSGALSFFGTTGNGYVTNGATNTANLPLGTLVSSASTFGTNDAATTGPQPWILNSSSNYFGFQFQTADATTHFGYGHVSISASLFSAPRTLIDFAWETTAGVGITVGATPAPGSLALLAVGALGLAGRRRK